MIHHSTTGKYRMGPILTDDSNRFGVWENGKESLGAMIDFPTQSGALAWMRQQDAHDRGCECAADGGCGWPTLCGPCAARAIA